MSNKSSLVCRRRRELKRKAVAYKGGKCSVCGYDRCIGALQFHHKDSSTKKFGISKEGFSKSWKEIKKELDKCILLCSNCHAEIHHVEAEEISYKPLKETKKCLICGKDCKNKYCSSSCLYLSRKTRTRPSEEQLREDIKELGYCGTGRKYGVSDNAIRKWLK